MKNIITIIALLVIVGVGYSQNNEKRIKFNKGTLKICSSSNMKISGYDGDEVIIKNLNNNKRFTYYNLKINMIIRQGHQTRHFLEVTESLLLETKKKN